MATLEKYYADQVQAGTVRFATGGQAGETVAEATGSTPSQKDIVAAQGKNASMHLKAQGDYKAAGKQAVKDQKAANGGGGKLVISPSSLLLKYFTFTQNGSLIPSSGNVGPDQQPGNYYP